MLRRLLLALCLVASTYADTNDAGYAWHHITDVPAPVSHLSGLHFSTSVSMEDVRAEAESRHVREGTYHEMFEFVATHIDHLDGQRFIAPGSFMTVEGVSYVMAAEVNGRHIHFTLDRMDAQWDAMTIFVVARPPDPSEIV